VRAALGTAAVLVPAWVMITRWSTLVAGHPAHPGLLAVLVLVGVVLLGRTGAGAFITVLASGRCR
jgi:hypothetical protein